MHIAIAGNIGCGKTTLTRMLAHHYGWEPHFEPVRENPYLADYYKDIARWAFNVEVFFLKERFRDVIEISRAAHDTIQDRSIYEGVYVFTRNNYEQGNLSERDYATYMELFDRISGIAGYPDLMLYLRASVPLAGLNKRYEDFITGSYRGRVLTIDVDSLDFQHDPKDFAAIVDKIDHQLYRLFPD